MGVTRNGFGVWCYDANNSDWSPTTHNFASADYELKVGSFDSSEIPVTFIPFVGDQYSGDLDRPGTRALFASNFLPQNIDKSNRGEFMIAIASLTTFSPFTGSGAITGSYEIVDPSGVRLRLPDGQVVNFPGASPEHTITIESLLDPVADASNYPNNSLFLLRDFGPDNTQFPPGTAAASALLGAPTQAELVMEYRERDVQNRDEDSLQISIYDPMTGDAIPIPTTTDPANNTLTAEIVDFTVYGVMGEEIIPTPVEDWEIYR